MPSLSLSLALTALLTAAVLVVAIRAARGYLKHRGRRLVTCPETERPAAVKIDAVHAGLTAAVTRSDVRLSTCSRWPERAHCGQVCLDQIESAPDGCLVTAMLGHWFTAKECALCGQPIGAVHWHDHRPALRRSDGRTLEWNEIDLTNMDEVLATHAPVCWRCHVAETFRREHPELVTERPGHDGEHRLYV